MPKILEDKKIKKGDCEVLYSKNAMACKWMDNQAVILLLLHLKAWMMYCQFKGD